MDGSKMNFALIDDLNPAQLVNYTASQNGNVSPGVARRFLNHIFYGALSITDAEQGTKGVSALPLEMKLNLYESIASDPHPHNPVYLASLNQEMGLTDAFYAQQAQSVRTFFADPAKLEQQWKDEGFKGSFADVMHQAVTNAPRMTEGSKKDLASFMSAAYADHCGRPRPVINFYAGEPSDCGYYRHSAQNPELGVNVRSTTFLTRPSDIIDTIIHEGGHGNQHTLVDKLAAGKINPTDPDYIAARVFRANFKNQGYISPDNIAGHDAYRYQPVEIASNFAGGLAVKLATEVYGKTGKAATGIANVNVGPRPPASRRGGAGFAPTRAAAAPSI
jgi:hypothetical protein